MQGEADVIVETGQLNYVAVGMLNAHYGWRFPVPNMALSAAHNLHQAWQGESGGLRNLLDISPGIKYMNYGSDFYDHRLQELGLE